MSDITSSIPSEAHQITATTTPGRPAINAYNRPERAASNNNMNRLLQVNSVLVLLALLAAALSTIQSAEARFRGDVHGGVTNKFGTAVVDTRGRSYRRLHEILSIGDDPSQDIRTNILLNMEGL